MISFSSQNMRRFVTAGALLFAACQPHRDVGALGNVVFSFDRCTVLIGDDPCSPATEKVAARSSANIVVSSANGGKLAFASVRSTDPTIAGFTTVDATTISVQAVSAGEAGLELVRDDGSVLDRDGVSVSEPTALAFLRVDDTLPLLVAENASVTGHVVRNQGPMLLAGRGGLTFSTSGGAILDAPSSADHADRSFRGEPFALHGLAGTGTLAVTDGFLTNHLAIQFVNPSEIAEVVVTNPPSILTKSGKRFVMADVEARVSDGSAVFGEQCAWTFSGPNVVVSTDPDVADLLPLFVDDGAGIRTIFQTDGGSASATCAIGSSSVVLDLNP